MRASRFVPQSAASRVTHMGAPNVPFSFITTVLRGSHCSSASWPLQAAALAELQHHVALLQQQAARDQAEIAELMNQLTLGTFSCSSRMMHLDRARLMIPRRRPRCDGLERPTQPGHG